MIRTWNVRTRQARKCLNEMERLKLEILGLCETIWPNSGDFWSDDYRIIHS